MSELSELLKEELSKYGAQTKFAKKVNVSRGVVSEWAAGKITPDFDSCLKIAEALDRDPVEIFHKASRPQFEDVYRKTKATGPRSTHDDSSESLYPYSPEHRDLHDKLEDILHVSPDGKNWPDAIARNIEAIHSAATGQPIEPGRKIAIVEGERATGPPREVKSARKRVRK